MRISLHRNAVPALMLLSLFLLPARAETDFQLGGFIKANMIASDYQDGEVGTGSALREFHLPALIPVGGESGDPQIDFNAKESRFNLGTATDLSNGEQVKTFLEMDFKFSDNGDERVSNSYQPRLRHAYFTYDDILVGQTWSTFMIVTLPDNLDFIGASEGMVFVRQSQVRFTAGDWQFALENPETTVTPYQGGARIDTDTGAVPDLVARYNLGGDWGALSVAGLYRQLSYNSRPAGVDSTANAYGINAGGKIRLGGRDDLRFVLTHGSGLGRYVALNFVNGAVLDANNELETIDTTSGYIAWLHHWNGRWRSSFDISAFEADNDAALTGSGVNRSADSISVNLLYSPDPRLTYGVELMRATRELESGADGSFNRIQFSAKYNFSFSSGR